MQDFVATCPECARGKASNQRPQGFLQPLSVPRQHWSHVALDFVTGLPDSRGMTTVLTIVDRFSKFVHFVALPKLPSSKETVELLFTYVFRLHGLPLEVTSDRGPQFFSRFWKAFCTLIGVKAQLLSGFHPQTNGQIERLNQELEKSLRCVIEKLPASWADVLPWVVYGHNSLPVSSTGLSPFTCCLVYQSPRFPEEERDVEVPAARLGLHEGSCYSGMSEMKRYANRCRRPAPKYTMGQRVRPSSRDIPLRTVCHKLAPWFIRPFTITRVIICCSS